MGFFATSICCLAFFSFFNFSPFLSLERALAQPIYQIKKLLDPQTIKPKDSYTIVLVGDSMTDYLGNLELQSKLKEKYFNKEIKIHNFSIGSTNILTLPDRLQNLTNFNGKISESILNTNFDLIIIESFGNNPLPGNLEDGFRKHNETMDKARKMIKDRQPQALVVLLATIAPHIDRYAEGIANLTTEERRKWAKERDAYIRNHIDYAKKNNLPLINVYQKSLDSNGGGNIDYINTGDFIHPSTTGVQFLNQEIAGYIFKNRLLPL